MFNNPFNPDPLNTPTCDDLNKKWNGDLPQRWRDCMNDRRKDMSDEEKHAAMKHCCDSEMQCSNPNAWFVKNNISDQCVSHKSPDQPHFGDVQMSLIHAHKVKKTLSFGVY